MSIIKPLVASQINVSSIGDTYTDVAGNTYAETTNQTRLTMAAYRRPVRAVISCHVSGGTGTFQLYNATDGTSLATAFTTSTTEVALNIDASVLTTNNGDDITIRVKNDTAGQSCTIDGGGIISGDTIQTGITSSTEFVLLVPSIGGYITGDVSIAVLKQLSTSTLAMPVGQSPLPGGFPVINPAFGSPITTADANTVVTRTPTTKMTGAYMIGLPSITGQWAIAGSVEVSTD